MNSEPEAQDPQVPVPAWTDPPPPVAAMAEILEALADPIRLSIVRALAEADGERPCGMFDLPVTKSTLTHHFRVLRLAGFLGFRYEGTRKLVHLRRADLEAAYPGFLDCVLQPRRSEPAPV